jgi:hypothetical protein
MMIQRKMKAAFRRNRKNASEARGGPSLQKRKN